LPSKKKAKFAPSAAAIAPPVAAIAPPAPIAPGFGRDLANWLFPGFLLLVLAGFFSIWKFGSSAGETNPVRAMFLAMSSATCTGFASSPGVASLTDTGQWISLLLIILGSLFTMIVGSLAVIRITRMPFKDTDVIIAALIVQAIVLLVGTSLLWDADRSPFQAMYLTASSFGNCGLYIADLPKPTDLPVHIVILPLALLGGIGLPVIMELWCALIFHAKISVHSKSVLAISAWIYILAVPLLMFVNQAGHGSPTTEGIKSQAISSSILAIESRTGGMPIVPISDVSAPAKWIIVILMIIGASPAGTGSGLKTTTLVELFRGARELLTGRNPGRSLGIAVVWLAAYLAFAAGAMLLLAYVSGMEPGDNIALSAISALSNVGFTTGTVPDEKGLFFAYSAIILVGKMAPLMILWWMADTTTAELAVG
jgi:trk system potassium uptake protein TrkH